MSSIADLPKDCSHLVTIGTTPPGGGPNVVEAIADDLKPAKPARVVVIATEDSHDNAKTLLKRIGIPAARGTIRVIESANSLEEAYNATNSEIRTLLDAGVPAREIVLHYTAGTKVMSAGAVLAALNHEVLALRYLYLRSRTASSEPVSTAPSALLGDRQFRLALTLTSELRFQTATDLLNGLDMTLFTDEQCEVTRALRLLAEAYGEWDNFRVGEFIPLYTEAAKTARQHQSLSHLLLKPEQIERLEKIRAAEVSSTSFPDELLVDLMNNAIRRLAERRPDDALARLYRAAELYAQGTLATAHGIRSDDVEIRKVPPRFRTPFESERRLDDATIKLGLRKSYELLEVLGDPIGRAFREHTRFRDILMERRSLVLAHGTRPSTIRLALDFYREVEDLFKVRIKDLRRRMSQQQFPWIDNARVLERLADKPEEHVPLGEKEAKGSKSARKAPEPAKKPGAAKGRRRGRRS